MFSINIEQQTYRLERKTFRVGDQAIACVRPVDIIDFWRSWFAPTLRGVWTINLPIMVCNGPLPTYCSQSLLLGGGFEDN